MAGGRPARAGTLALGLVLLAGLLAGCAKPSVEFVSYKDPYFPEKIHIQFEDCAYWIEPGGDIRVAGRATQTTDNGTITHYLLVHIFWKPKPGKTYANATATDATYRYILAGDDGAALYLGTGFAFPRDPSAGKMLVGLDQARLRLESKRGEVPDLLGDTRLSGKVVARNDAAQAVDLIREAELRVNP